MFGLLILLYLLLSLVEGSDGFSVHVERRNLCHSLAATESSPTVPEENPIQAPAAAVSIDSKEAVKLFGRLAEKYIMLDASAGMCCYSACSDCEFRLPGGGYRMSDQSAARPKWIPNYDSRSANNKEHITKWSAELFGEEENDADRVSDSALKLSQDTFVERIKQMAYAPTLGGPYLAASAAIIEDDGAAVALFHVLANGKEFLTRSKMSVRLKQLANGEEGLTWTMFERALSL